MKVELEDDIANRLQQQAKDHRRTPEAELNQILDEHLKYYTPLRETPKSLSDAFDASLTNTGWKK